MQVCEDKRQSFKESYYKSKKLLQLAAAFPVWQINIDKIF
jgi:hypothetical protein